MEAGRSSRRGRSALRVALAAVACLLAPRASSVRAATFTVVSTNDGGPGSLRQAVIDANASPGPDTIQFSIQSGPQTISPASPLPTIDRPLTIDGTTQPGFAGTPIIELDGSMAGPGAIGLRITGGSSRVRGLVINRFSAHGIELDTTGGNVIEGNFIGTDVNGGADLGNSIDGLRINGAPGNMIGGTILGAGNLLSGNNSKGIEILGSSATGNVVQGNLIGTDVTGTAKVPNGGGVIVNGAPGNTIGGVTDGARNVISGNLSGVQLLGSVATDNVVQGNLIGTDITGTRALGNSLFGVGISQAPNNTIGGTTDGAQNVVSGNGNGIQIGGAGATGNVVEGNLVGIDITGTLALGNVSGVSINAAPGNRIGGTAPGAGNVISGNTVRGVALFTVRATRNLIQGNFIGTDVTGTGPLGNGLHGVVIDDGFDNEIGGTAAGAGNVIAFNSGGGIVLSSGSRDASLANSIFSNGGLGIDLFGNGVTPDDPGDADSGPNEQQNYPLLTSATSDGAGTTIEGTLNSSPNQTFRLEFFLNQSCDPAGFGEGETFVGFTAVSTDAWGNASFTASFPTTDPGLRFVTATATDPNHNTSEFSRCVEATRANQPPVAACRDVTVEAGQGGTAEASMDAGSFDPDRGSITLRQSPPGPYPLGTTAVILTVTDDEGAADSCSATATVVDLTPAQIEIIGCPETVLLGVGATVAVTVTDSPSGVAFQSVPNGTHPLDASIVGPHTFEVSARDGAGNESTGECAYRVTYNFEGAGGFQPPVRNPPDVNKVHAGSTMPVKWRLPDGRGGFVGDLGAVIAIQLQEVACADFSTVLSAPAQAETSGGAGLRYDAFAGQYIYKWKTSKSQAGHCFSLILRLNDGSEHPAHFEVTR